MRVCASNPHMLPAAGRPEGEQQAARLALQLHANMHACAYGITAGAAEGVPGSAHLWHKAAGAIVLIAHTIPRAQQPNWLVAEATRALQDRGGDNGMCCSGIACKCLMCASA